MPDAFNKPAVGFSFAFRFCLICCEAILFQMVYLDVVAYQQRGHAALMDFWTNIHR
jgi:hypothetical protein